MGLTLEVIAKAHFDQFDADGSGELSMEELKTCIQNMDDLVIIAEIEEILGLCDTDHSGSVSFDEFRAMMPTLSVVSQI